MNTIKPLPALVQSFFGVALPQRGFSRLTIRSYRDAMKLLLRYAAERTGLPVVKLDFMHLTEELIRDFLVHLENDRGNEIATRNNRLAALRTFFSYVAADEPALVDYCRRICIIPMKRAPVPTVPYLEKDEMDALLEAPDRATSLGRGHHAVLLFLYNTGARVDELIGVRGRCLELTGAHRQVLLRGKGQKERICPLWQITASTLREQLANAAAPMDSDKPVFLNRCGEPLTRFGVNYIVKKYARVAAAQVSSLGGKRISAHTIRHTTAVHLLNSGVDINVVRSWLGHVDLRTTNIYAEMDLATKRKAIEACMPEAARNAQAAAWKRSPDILSWLETL